MIPFEHNPKKIPLELNENEIVYALIETDLVQASGFGSAGVSGTTGYGLQVSLNI